MNIRTKILYFLKGGLIAKFFALITFLFIANVVSLEIFAIYTIFLFISQGFTVILSYGFNSYIMRNSNKNIRLEIFPKTIYTILVSFLTFSIFLYPLKGFIIDELPLTYKIILDYFAVVLIIVFLKIINQMILGYFVSNHKANLHMNLNIFQGIITLIIFLLFYHILSVKELDLILYSLTIAYIFSSIYSIYLIKNISLIKPINFKEMLFLMYESFPFMLKTLIGIIGLYLSRLILDSIATKEELAIFSFYLMIIFQLSFLVNIITQSIIPTLRDDFDNFAIYKLKLKKYLKIYIFSVFNILIFLLIISYFIVNEDLKFLQYFIKIEYLKHIWLFDILIMAFFIRSLKGVFDVWQYHEKMKIKLKLIIISSSNVLLGLILYPLAYKVGNIYGVAFTYVFIISIFTYVSFYYFKDLSRRIEIEKNVYYS